MATVPQVQHDKKPTIDEATAQMADLIEEFFDENNLSEEERNRRVADFGEFIKDVSAARAKA